MRVINHDGEQLGVMPIADAMREAMNQSMDLALISPQAKPPVAKIMNYGRYKYEQSKREREARKKQHVVSLKEIRMSPTIEENDLNTKARHAIKFLQAGNKVKLTIRFRGRQVVHSRLGRAVLEQFGEQLNEYGKADARPKMEGRNMSVIYSPLKKKEQ